MPPGVGYNLSLYRNLLKKNKVLPRYYPKVFFIGLINVINMPFRFYESKRINTRIEKEDIAQDPIFIIGHWRSGTTFLHNLLAQDKQMGFVTTYQSVFPDTVCVKAGKFLFKTFTKIFIPPTRKGDRVKLDPDYPQEEEFALGSRNPFSYYYFWWCHRTNRSNW